MKLNVWKLYREMIGAQTIGYKDKGYPLYYKGIPLFGMLYSFAFFMPDPIMTTM